MKSIVMPVPEVTGTEQVSKETKEKNLSKKPATTGGNKTKFTAMDMWNRNKQSRSASDRIRRWNLN